MVWTSSSCVYLTSSHVIDTAHFRPVNSDYQVYIPWVFTRWETLFMLVSLWSSCPSQGCTNRPTHLQVFSVLGWWNLLSHLTFKRDGTKLANCPPHFGLRTWDIANLTDEHWHSAHGYARYARWMGNGSGQWVEEEYIRATAWNDIWDTPKEGNKRGPL